MDKTEQRLRKETVKWLEQLEAKKQGHALSKEAGEQLANVRAYIKDCRHFMGKKDFIRAFEAVIYAWGIFDTLSNTHLIKNTGKKD